MNKEFNQSERSHSRLEINIAEITSSPLLLSRKEAARHLNVAAQTLSQWACSGKVALPYVKIGRKVAYRTVDIDAFIAANMHGISQAQAMGAIHA